MELSQEQLSFSVREKIQKCLTEIDQAETYLDEKNDVEAKMVVLKHEFACFDEVLDLIKSGLVCRFCRKNILNYYLGTRVL